jgi:hypothetical protein
MGKGFVMKISEPYPIEMTWVDIEDAPDDIIYWVDTIQNPLDHKPLGFWGGISLSIDDWEDADEAIENLPAGWYNILLDLFHEQAVDKVHFWSGSNDVQSDE